MSSLNGSTVVPMQRPATGGDRVRTAALLAATAAQVVVPVIGPLLGQSEIAEVSKRTKSIVTPPDWAFGVWGPIFTGSAATAVVQALPTQRTAPASRRAGWWLAAAAGGNALWEWVAQSGRYRATPPILWGIVAAAGAAHVALQRVEPTGQARLATGSNGMLLGWTSLAASINTADVLLNVLDIDPDTRRGVSCPWAWSAAPPPVSRRPWRRAGAVPRRWHPRRAGACPPWPPTPRGRRFGPPAGPRSRAWPADC